MTLSGKELRSQVWISRSAVDNYSRFTDGPENTAQARLLLLQAIEENGVFSYDPPEWMTSRKPGVDAYIFLENFALTLKKQSGRQGYVVSNCIACRRRPGRRQEKLSSTQAQQETPQQVVAAFSTASQRWLADNVLFSAHAVERFEQRTGISADADQLRALVAASGVFYLRAPSWANAAGRVGASALIVTQANQQIALLLQFDSAQDSMVVTSAISWTWAQQSLPTSSQQLVVSKQLKKRLLLNDEQAQTLMQNSEAWFSVDGDGAKLTVWMPGFFEVFSIKPIKKTLSDGRLVWLVF